MHSWVHGGREREEINEERKTDRTRDDQQYNNQHSISSRSPPSRSNVSHRLQNFNQAEEEKCRVTLSLSETINGQIFSTRSHRTDASNILYIMGKYFKSEASQFSSTKIQLNCQLKEAVPDADS